MASNQFSQFTIKWWRVEWQSLRKRETDTDHLSEFPRSKSITEPSAVSDEQKAFEVLQLEFDGLSLKQIIANISTLTELSDRPRDIDEWKLIIDLFPRWDLNFELIWPGSASETTSGQKETDVEFWKTLEHISRYLLRLQNRRGILKATMQKLKFITEILLRPLQSRVQEVTNTHGSYNYRSLEYCPTTGVKEIRILHLEDLPGDELRCRIEHIDISSPGHLYTALSYEWGSSDEVFWIEVVDFEGVSMGIIPITNNLFSALKDIKSSSEVKVRTFWVDQICINQKDVVERGHQVTLMGKVYTAAAKVISYLGPPDVYDENSFKLLHSIDHQYQHLFQGSGFHEDVVKLRETYKDLELIPKELQFHGSIDKSMLRSLEEIIYGPWTRRLWMIQEESYSTCLNRAKDGVLMLRGNQLIPWTIVAHAALVIAANLVRPGGDRIELGTPEERIVLFLCWQFRNSGHAYSADLNTLLIACSGTALCLEPRDHVFGLLGMASDAEHLGIIADYSKSHDEVLLDVSVRFLKDLTHRTRSIVLDYWSPENVVDSEQGRLPSWVCRWLGAHKYPSPLGDHFAAGEWNSMTHVSASQRCVYWPGIRVASLVQATVGFEFLLSGRLNITRLVQIESTIATLRSYLRNSSTDQSRVDDTITKTFCPQLDYHEAESVSYDQHITALLNIVDIAKGQLQQPGHDSNVELLSLLNLIPKNQRAAVISIIEKESLYGRLIALADQDRICLAPAHAQASDIVVVLSGASQLYVLRPAGTKFRYVGNAYMNGVMGGEVVQTARWREGIEDYSII